MAWEPPEGTADERAKALLEAIKSRKDLKRFGQWLQASGDLELRQAVVRLGRLRGADLPDEAEDWPGKRLLRRAQGRETESRVRTNPIARDEDFECMFCAKQVPAHGRTARDHCPWCLRSRHVDVVPGDRAEECHGRLDPYDVDIDSRGIRIRYRCTRCGKEGVNRAITDGEVPDVWSVLVKLSSGGLA
jgi:hypothetical protein